MTFTPFLALVKKDLLLFFKDRRSVMMSVAAPIAIASFFGLILAGAGSKGDRQRIIVWLCDEDRSALTVRLGEKLQAESSLAIKQGTAVAAQAEVKAGNAAAAIILGKGFGESAGPAMLGAADQAPLKLLFDPSRTAEFEMVKGILTGHVMEAASQEAFGGGAGTRSMIARSLVRIRQDQDMPKDRRKALTEMLQSVDRWSATTNQPENSGIKAPAGGLRQPYHLIQEAVTARPEGEYNSFAHSFTGMGVQFILFMGIEAGVMLLQQRQRGLWKRLRAAPISRSLLLTSRAVSAALSALLIMAVLFTFARVVFGVKIEGSLPGFLIVCLSFALMTAAFGLLVAAYGKTPEATRPLAILVTLLMVMLGGSWVPSFLFPAWLEKATKIIPTRWAVDGLNGMTWRGLGFDYALTCSGMLLIFAAVFAGVAVRKFRWETDCRFTLPGTTPAADASTLSRSACLPGFVRSVAPKFRRPITIVRIANPQSPRRLPRLRRRLRLLRWRYPALWWHRPRPPLPRRLRINPRLRHRQAPPTKRNHRLLNNPFTIRLRPSPDYRPGSLRLEFLLV